MKLILFYGENDSGKTTHCRELFNFLKINPLAKYNIEELNDNDFKALIELPQCSISFYSAGDDQKTISESFEWATFCNSTYHIGAIRKKTHYNDLLKKYGFEDIIWIQL